MVNPKNLFDAQFISSYFSQRITSPKYKNISWAKVRITPIKKNIGSKNSCFFYHFVIRYDVPNLCQPIFCSAHWEENRENAFRALKFIQNKIENFAISPLFYSQRFRALFYLGVNGENLQFYIKHHPDKVESIIISTASWLANLHNIKINPKIHNFNPANSRVETIIPGSKIYFKKIKHQAPEFLSGIKQIFQKINEFDKKNLKKNGHYLIHGDFHPENIIIHNENPIEITIIDYTDVCIADFARDLGNFSHQLNYMAARFNPVLIKKLPELEKIFMESYLKQKNIKITNDLRIRINIYMAWAALRNAVFFLIKQFQEVKEAEKSIDSAQKYLNSVKK